MRVRVASAGTGKTTSLVRRYLELIDEGRPLRRIAGVTFTRAAADELRQRVGAGLHEVRSRGHYLGGLFTARGDLAPFRAASRELQGAVLSTIHGFMIATLRLSAPVLGLDPEFGLLGEWEAAAMFDEEVHSLRMLALDPGHPAHAPFELLGEDAEAWLWVLFNKRSLTPTATLAPAAGSDARSAALIALFGAAYERYERRLGAVLLAPGEVERRGLRLLDVPRARARVVERFPVVLVDEYQDVNPLQGRFFERLEEAGAFVEVVGDPKQSIYGFRNADVGVFRRAHEAAASTGDVLEPLTQTRRHARSLTAFLNEVTDGFAARGLGFGPREAPPVQPAGAQALVDGSVSLHWVVGDAPIGQLRTLESRVLADALRDANERLGIDYDDMAVLAYSYASLAMAEAALAAAQIPNLMVQGRGYYDRSEIRDLVHALRVGIAAEGLSLAAFLRGPFGQVRMSVVDQIMRSRDPLAAVAALEPEVAERIDVLRGVARLAPLDALKRLIREPLVEGKRYGEFLSGPARQNVDALLFEVAASPPGDLEVLLERLELLSRQADAGDVPQSGAGVRLLSVHRSKGLEFRVVAVFDAGRGPFDRPEPLYLDADTAVPHLVGSPGYEAAWAATVAKDEQERYRLLYVALSRARDVLLVTGSVKRQQPAGWAAALAALGYGPGRQQDTRAAEPLGVSGDATGSSPAAPEVHVHPFREVPTLASRPARPTVSDAPEAPWTRTRFPSHPYPPVFSPSRLKLGSSSEPLPPSDPEAAPMLRDGSEEPAGRGAAVGTLVHYAISQGWRPDDDATMHDLGAQEVMFPFTDMERRELLQDVAELLRAYFALLGSPLPLIEMRERDQAEVPVAVPLGSTVWQGVIDRLYRVDGRWVVEDYKTDRQVRPERYHFQLALYVHAVERALGERPSAQLVFLRSSTVVPLEDAVLRAAFDEVLSEDPLLAPE